MKVLLLYPSSSILSLRKSCCSHSLVGVRVDVLRVASGRWSVERTGVDVVVLVSVSDDIVVTVGSQLVLAVDLGLATTLGA